MDLQGLRRRVRSLIREPRQNYILDDELNDWINDMSYEATRDINYPYEEVTVAAVEDQEDYTLETDYVRLHPLFQVYYAQKKLGKYGTQWMERQYPGYKDATAVIQPENYYFKSPTQISLYPGPSAHSSGTATTGSALAELYDSTASFSEKVLGYTIYNTTDGSTGTITAVTSSTQLTATLTGGTANVWTVSDAWKIMPNFVYTHVYKEAQMTEDTDENLMVAKFPWLVIYRILPMAELKCFRTDNASLVNVKTKRWDTLYVNELTRAKTEVHKQIRGHEGRTISPVRFNKYLTAR